MFQRKPFDLDVTDNRDVFISHVLWSHEMDRGHVVAAAECFYLARLIDEKDLESIRNWLINFEESYEKKDQQDLRTDATDSDS